MDWLNWGGLDLEQISPNTPHQITKVAKVSHMEFDQQEGIHIMEPIHLLQVCNTIDLILLSYKFCFVVRRFAL